jgi:hypothetical protein
MHPGYITFQFEIKNLLQNISIRNVSVTLTLNDTLLQLFNEIKAPSIGYKEIGYCYSILSYEYEAHSFPVASFKAKMVFTLVEFDSNTGIEEGSYADEYVLPDVTLSAKDFVVGKLLSEEEFK